MLTVSKLLKSTQKLRKNASGVASSLIDLDPIAWSPSGKTLKIRATVYSEKGQDIYRARLVFHDVTASATKGPNTILALKKGEDTMYLDPVSENKTAVSARCTCSDYYYVWWKWNYENGAHAGKPMPEYIPVPGSTRPPVNPQHLPGMCVAAGTKVYTSQGSKNIEHVKAGDYVLTMGGYQAVEQAVYMGQKETVTLSTANRSVTLTPDHRIYAQRRGTSKPVWIEAGKLEPETWSLVVRAPGQEPASEVLTAIQPDTVRDVYDLSVPNGEHFTANGVVVHNCKHLIGLVDLAEREGWIK